MPRNDFARPDHFANDHCEDTYRENREHNEADLHTLCAALPLPPLAHPAIKDFFCPCCNALAGDPCVGKSIEDSCYERVRFWMHPNSGQADRWRAYAPRAMS